MQMVPVNSSNLESVGYENGMLYIRFRSGGLYSYAGVPAAVYAALMQAPSHGSFFHAHIKNVYPYSRIS